MPKVAVVMGSKSDWTKMKDAWLLLKQFQVETEVAVASAHRTPELLKTYLSRWDSEKVDVIIAGAGMSAHLPGVVAAYTLTPVIGVPLSSQIFDGEDALYSIVMMPAGIPVATVGVDNVKNAALLSLQILAIQSPEIKARLVQYRKDLAAAVNKANEELQQELMS